MPSISDIGNGSQTVYGLPIHAGLVTATVNGSNAPIASQDPTRVVLSSAPANGTAVVITYQNTAGSNVVNSAMPRDASGNSVQALAPDTTANVAIGAASVTSALPAGAQIVRIASNAKCFFKFGGVAVTATGTDSMFPLGVELFVVPVGATYIAAIQDGAVTGSLNITKMV